MASENETVAEIVQEMRRDAIAADAWCETHGEMASAASVLSKHADRILAAHNREVAELKNIINAECNHCGDCAKFGKDCNAGDVDGAEDNRACEKFVSKEVTGLRGCLAEYKVQMLCDDGDWVDSMFNPGDGRLDLEGARDLVRNVCALRANERMDRITYRIVARDVTPWREVERTADTECEMTDEKNKKDKETK